MRLNIQHPTHRCGLVASYLENAYVCDGCEEEGVGWRYSCQPCNYDLHSCCACNTDASPLLMHPFHNKECHGLRFLYTSKPPGTNFFPPCNACGMPVRGFAYRCMVTSCGYVLHPCCAHLPPTMTVPLIASPAIGIEIAPSVDLSLHNGFLGQCELCGGSAPGWCYATSNSDYCVHVLCARRMLLSTAKGSHALTHHNHQSQAGSSTQQLQLVKMQKNPKRCSFRRILKSAAYVVRLIAAVLFGDPLTLTAGAVTLLQGN